MADNGKQPESSVAKDLVAGTVAGWAQVMVGQPFDIVKVRMQSAATATSPIATATGILKNEGPSAFYKGTVMPLIGIGACVSLQFAFLQAGKRFFVSRNRERGSGDPDRLSLTQLYLSGVLAGVGNSVASGPVEHIRIRLQTQSSATTAAYSGPFDALRKIHATDGMRGIFQGQVATIVREGYGYGLYFLTYEWLVQREMDKRGCARTAIPMTKAAAFGAAAGWAMWLMMYPLDVVKSRMQTDGFPSQGALKKYRSTLDCARQLYAEGGLSTFTRGLTPTLVRSPFVNATTFVVFELTMRQLNRS